MSTKLDRLKVGCRVRVLYDSPAHSVYEGMEGVITEVIPGMWGQVPQYRVLLDDGIEGETGMDWLEPID